MPYAANKYNLDLLSEDNVKKYVLPQYNLSEAEISRVKFKNTDKQRAVYKINLNDKCYCLKKVYFSKNDLLFVYSAIEWLYRNNIKVPRLLPTISNGRFVEYNQMLFILTPWIEGEKCDYDIKEHILLAVNNLAHMHKRCVSFTPINGSTLRNSFDNINVSLNKHFNQLLTSYNLALKHQDKFSRFLLQNFERNLLLGQIAIHSSSGINIVNLKSSLCHLDYVNKNIIFDTEKKPWVIDFDKCSIDYCAHDISYFLRRLLKRDSTHWDLELAITCLNIYEEIHSLTIDDYKYILAYLSFPQKFWKISKDYYNNIKKCNRNSFLFLLMKAVQNDKEHLDFVIGFGKYIENRFNMKIY